MRQPVRMWFAALVLCCGCGSHAPAQSTVDNHATPPSIDEEFRVGSRLYHDGEYAAAIRPLARVIELDPGGELAEYAANMILDGCNRRRAYEELKAWATKMEANALLVAKHPELGTVLHRLNHPTYTSEPLRTDH